jgi:hypothetical protein
MRYNKRYYETIYSDKIVEHIIQRSKYNIDYGYVILKQYILTESEVNYKVPPPQFISMMWNRYCIQDIHRQELVWLQLRVELLKMKQQYHEEQIRKLMKNYDRLSPKTKIRINSSLRKVSNMMYRTK